MFSSPTRISIFCILFNLILQLPVFAQTSTQRIKGRLLDQESGEPIAGAEIELMNYVPIKIATTNEYGDYELRGIPIGVHRFLIIHEQYQTLIVPDIEVLIEQPTLLNIKMKKEVFANSLGTENKESTASVVIRTRFTEKEIAENPNLLNAVEVYYAEEQNRYAGSREDVFQLLSNFEGIQPQAAYLNSISIAGKTPLFTKTQIEGVDIQQIQHAQHPFSGTGAFAILSPDNLGDFDVLKAGHQASVNSGTAGLINIQLKTADLNKNHLSLKISPLSIGISSAIPINRKLGQSLALGYRHSSMQWITPFIEYPIQGSSPLFQDAFFKLNLAHNKSGDYKVFGLLGQSNFQTGSNSWWPLEGQRNIHNEKLTGLLGAKHDIRLAPKIYLKSLFAFSHQKQDFVFYDSSSGLNNTFQNTESKVQLESEAEFKIDREHSLFIGLKGNGYKLMLYQHHDGFAVNSDLFSFDTELSSFMHAKVGRKLSFNAGLRAHYLGLNQTYALSPSASMRWDLGNHAIVSHLAIAQDRLPWWVYLQEYRLENGDLILRNLNLPYMRSYQFMLGHHWRLAENWLLKIEGYYHYYDNVLAAADSNLVFLFPNMNILEFNARVPALNADATGYHTGIDVSVERFWYNNFYLKWNASLLDANYQTVDGRKFNARYNSRYHTTLLAGKQFDFGPWGSNQFGVDARFIYSGGWYYTPIDELASATANRTVLNWEKAWNARSSDYFSLDLRLRLNLNSNHWTHQFSIEGLNLFNVQASSQYFYQNGNIQNWSNMGRAILFSYKVDFGWVYL